MLWGNQREEASWDSSLTFFFLTIPMVYESSWARGQIGAEAAALHHSHGNVESEPHLQPMLKLAATPDP